MQGRGNSYSSNVTWFSMIICDKGANFLITNIRSTLQEFWNQQNFCFQVLWFLLVSHFWDTKLRDCYKLKVVEVWYDHVITKGQCLGPLVQSLGGGAFANPLSHVCHSTWHWMSMNCLYLSTLFIFIFIYDDIFLDICQFGWKEKKTTPKLDRALPSHSLWLHSGHATTAQWRAL